MGLSRGPVDAVDAVPGAAQPPLAVDVGAGTVVGASDDHPPRPVASFVPNPSDRGAGGSSSDESSKSSAMDAGGGASEPPPRRRPIGGAPRRAGRGPNRSSSIAQDQARARLRAKRRRPRSRQRF